MRIPPLYVAAGAAVALAMAYVAWKGAKGTGAALGGAAVDLADGVIAGTVTGIGSAVGIPQTNETECEKAIREGRTWDASFACPAGRFLKYIFN